MRQLNEVFWARETNEDLRVGFTPDGLVSLGQIWQFIPRVAIGDQVQGGQAIATIESTSALRSLLIPITGRLSWINPAILEYPETISEKTDIFAFSKAGHALFSL